jgi:diadenosine tetraphosphate (Ap4A) HIT family hydrolase
MFLLFMSIANSLLFSENPYVATETPLWEGQHVRVVIPASPLTPHSVQIVSQYGGRRFAEWTEAEDLESYELLQKIAARWAENGIHDYLIIERENNITGDSVGWEIVPYPKGGVAIWKQFQVAIRVFFGGIAVDDAIRQRMIKESAYLNAPIEEKLYRHTDPPANCAFCKPAVIESQQVVEGKSVRVLYDYRPLVDNHFLVIPKEHEQQFSDVPRETYLEASKFARLLIKKFGAEGSSVYLYHKTGRPAGQTVPHWHLHVVLPVSKNEETLGKLKQLFRMVWGTPALKRQELDKRVTTLRAAFKRYIPIPNPE